MFFQFMKERSLSNVLNLSFQFRFHPNKEGFGIQEKKDFEIQGNKDAKIQERRILKSKQRTKLKYNLCVYGA